jgi:hypothetical protein
MNNIIFTTAYKDIKRQDWKYFNRTNEEYFYGFMNLSQNINYILVVYIENDLREILLKKNTYNDNIKFMDLNMVNTFYKKYLDNDKKIMESENYKNKIPINRKANPEHLYSEYNLINHSKINFVKHTKDCFPNYKYYAWIDFGNMNYEIESIPKNINFDRLESKIIYKCILKPPIIRPTSTFMLSSNDIYFLGSSFIVFNNLVNKFEELYEKKIIKWQNDGISDDDQNLLLQLYYDNKSLFQLIYHPKWFGFYLALK